MTTLPIQYTTADRTLEGAGGTYTFNPFPAILEFTPQDAVLNYLFFRNGVLMDEGIDYAVGPGYIEVTIDVLADDIFTARTYRGAAASKLFPIQAGVTAIGTQNLWLSPYGPVDTTPQPLMLFRNGVLQTQGYDYLKNGPWINLLTAPLLDDTQAFVIGMGGAACSTFSGTITGAVDGLNRTFVLPAGTVGEMLFRNGILQTINKDYTRSGATVVFAQPPVPGDILTAQAFTGSVPGQITTVDNSMRIAVAAAAWVFVDGLLQVQPFQATVSGNTIRVGG